MTKKCIGVPVKYAEAFSHLTQEARGHQHKIIRTIVNGDEIKVLKLDGSFVAIQCSAERVVLKEKYKVHQLKIVE